MVAQRKMKREAQAFSRRWQYYDAILCFAFCSYNSFKEIRRLLVLDVFSRNISSRTKAR